MAMLCSTHSWQRQSSSPSSFAQGDDENMKDVGWGEFLISLIVAPILVLPVVAAVYLLFFVLLGYDSGSYHYWLQVTMIVACVSEGLFFASRYEGLGSPIEHGWAWLAVVAIVAAVAAGLYALGVASAEVSLEFAMIIYNYEAWAFIITMLSVFFSARTKPVDPIDKRRTALERSARIWTLRR